MVATAHGIDLSSLMSNPELVTLIGGIEQTTLGDQAAADQAKSTGQEFRKTKAERKGSPVFDYLIEVVGQGEWRLHRDVAKSVDSMLSGGKGHAERRRYVKSASGGGDKMVVSFESALATQMAVAAAIEDAGVRSVLNHRAAKTGAGDWLFDLMHQADLIANS